FAACLDQCEWADKLGFESVALTEHHGSEDGYNPSPLTLAAAVAARTSRLRIRIAALILPLHDPIRVAEDAAVVDQISRGRLELIIGAGYVAQEFAMFGKDLADRAQAQTEAVEVLKQAWTGEPFAYRGATITVTPRPFQDPRPPLILGGSSGGAARRAARIADGFVPTLPHFAEVYREECRKLGRPEPPPAQPSIPALFVHIAEDPDKAWSEIAPHALHETNSYGAWLAAAGDSPGPYTPFTDADQLRQSGMYLVLTPEELLERARALGPGGAVGFHPLMGGLDPALAWDSLRLFETRVLPALRAEGLAG
ncbi:MAG: LLM class flavin-dependent oxidoreductase, partial [Acidimicrobiaceae bacterium]|nr:LLM class flavin-dependent oxidoreductase [Acidimicrobiaceae bacterium]